MASSTERDADRAAAETAVADSGRLLSTAMILFHTSLSKKVGLGPTDEKVLELVQRHRNVSPRQLAELTGLAKNSITDVLDRLARRGFVTRQPDPADGRKVIVVAADEGIARIAAHFAGLMGRLADLNAAFSPEELRVVAEYQRRAAEIQEDEARRLAAG
ncbi:MULTISPECIES: MarR family transcriptional regulator [Polymorphospora]|uniref:MarR family transcriptional regulator n=1 Tax=Polymorphospora lycopeni TaxID=3140240 RepID=A0ABV5CM17_9ACTN